MNSFHHNFHQPHCKYCGDGIIVQQHLSSASPFWIHVKSGLNHCHADHTCTIEAEPCKSCASSENEDLPLES